MGSCASAAETPDNAAQAPLSTSVANRLQEQRSRSKRDAAPSAGSQHTLATEKTVNPLRTPDGAAAALHSNNNGDSACVNGSFTLLLSHVGSDDGTVTITGIPTLSLGDYGAAPREDGTAGAEHRPQSPRSTVDSRPRASRSSASLRSSNSETRASLGSDRPHSGSQRKSDKLVTVEFISLSAKGSGGASNGSPRSRPDSLYSFAISAAQSAANRRSM